MSAVVGQLVLIWIAFLLVYFQDHLRNTYLFLLPKPFSRSKWGAVVKGTVTKHTALPLIVLAILVAAYVITTVRDVSAENRRFDSLTSAIEKQTQRIDSLISLIEAQYGSANNTASK